MTLVRAAAWRNNLAGMGIPLPLFVVFDLGVMLSSARGAGGYEIAIRTAQVARISVSPAQRSAMDQYRRLIQNIAESDIAERLAGMRLRDELVGVLLARIIGDTFHRWRDKSRATGVEELPLDVELLSDVDYASHYPDFDQRQLWSFLGHVVAEAMNVYTQVELIDLDTLRLLGMFKDGSGNQTLGAGLDIVDLFSALGSPEAHDVANFSLDLLPSVLETRRASGVQTFAVDGYASLERRGNVDSMVLSELAYPREIFDQKVVDSELLYYGRDKHREDERRLHYILIDASASMRGQRQVFARGLALALLKKLSLKGDEIWLRFFDSRLHEITKINRSGQVPVPHILSFRSERGRNYGRVFRQLVIELGRVRLEQKRNVVLYIVTHGQCHLEPELVTQLKGLAFVYGIVVLPTGPLPEFVSMIDRSQVVDSDAVSSRTARQKRALDIVGDVAGQPPTNKSTVSPTDVGPIDNSQPAGRTQP
jgi:hypothetical protein